MGDYQKAFKNEPGAHAPNQKRPQFVYISRKTFERLEPEGYLAAFMRNIRFINERLIVLWEIKRKGLAGMK
jgi:hypothetical protein